MEDGIDQFAHGVALLIAEAEGGNQKTKHLREEKLSIEINHVLADFYKRLRLGVQSLVTGLQEVAKENHAINAGNVMQDLEKCVSYFSRLNTHFQEYLNHALQDDSIQETTRISDGTMEALYSVAKYYYDREHYKEAADAFIVLASINPKVPAYWLGLANAEFFCHHYEPSLMAYSVATHLDPTNPFYQIYSARCYEEIQDIENAIGALELAELIIDETNTHTQLKPEIVSKKQQLKTKK
jgi:tetratricopeptide (TPR) repeat protein